MTSAEMKVLFKAVQDSSVKKVVDNIKGEVNSLGGTISAMNKKMGGDILGGTGGSASFRKLNPNLFAESGQMAGKNFTSGFTKTMEKELKSKATFFKDLTFMLQPLLNPTSIWGNMFAARQGFSAFATPYGQNAIGGGGATGALKATAILQGTVLAVGLSLKVLREALSFTANEIKKSFAFAHQLYGRSLSSGLSLNFMAQRQMTASVLGVPENEIFRFKQSAQVIRQLSFAVAEISNSAPQLAYTSAQFKILELNILGAASKLAVSLTPALNGFALVMDKLIEVLSNSKVLKFIQFEFIAMFPKLAAAFAALSVVGGKSQTLGQPQTFMKQLGVGTFERMGLVVGGQSMALDYARRTAVGVEKLVHKSTNPHGIPRGGIGILSPAFNMP